MESVDLTTMNLIKLGLTPEILKTDFENWIYRNDNFVIDFDSMKIHIGKKNLKHQTDFSLALHKKELLDQGMSEDAINEYFATTKANVKAKLEKQLYSFPEELQLEFLVKYTNICAEELSKIIDNKLLTIYDNMFEDDQSSDDVERVNQKDKNIKELYNHIFTANAFEVWQSMYIDFKIQESSRTDIKFMFEIMKYEKLIHPTVTQTALLNWINETYQLTISKARYIDFKNDTKRLAIFNKAKSMYLEG